MEITVAQYIARFLKARQVEFVFELSGGMIMHLLDTIEQEGGIEIVNVHHEQAAAFAADAMGRVSGRPGVTLGTSGPGAINLLTGVGSSYFDSSPTVFITGQVNRHERKGARNIRQLGFQETDIVAMAKPITKLAVGLTQPAEILHWLPQAFRLATAGRPGSVLIDIPMDIFRAKITIDSEAVFLQEADARQAPVALSEGGAEKLAQDLSAAKRPLILAGGGVRAGGSETAFLQLVETWGVPVVHSLMAVDLLPFGHPLRIGMIGTYGNRWANLALAESDFLLVLGSRLDIRQTGADTAGFARDKTIYHVDVEGDEINNRVTGCRKIVAALQDFIPEVLRLKVQPPAGQTWTLWRTRISELREKWPDIAELRGVPGINPNILMHRLAALGPVAAFAVDVGLHQMWAAQSVEIGVGARFITSGGMGAMGFALPAGIGAALFHHKQKPVVVIAGDAGFQLNLQELQTVVYQKLPLKIVVMNNRCHGMTRQFQDTYFNGRHIATVEGYSTPDFTAVARGYGIEARKLIHPAEIEDCMHWLRQNPLQAQLLEVEIDVQTNAYPKLAFGRPISEMEPLAKPLEMEGT